MTDTYMTLKILYTLDNGATGSYLARSRTPHLVKVVNIPEPNELEVSDSGESMLRVGAVHISSVLEEIYQNSPEVLSILDTNCEQDYNLYYRDICEYEEPLVSLGLLSQLRKKLENKKQRTQLSTLEEEQEGDDSEEDEFIVTGRVCSNLSALLRRSYSNMNKKNGASSTTPETLEVKLRFTRMTRTPVARKSFNEITQRAVQTVPTKTQQPRAYQHQIHVNQNKSTSTKPKPKVIKQNTQMGAPTTTTNTTVNNANRRQTNPMPAPKAKRTQSLPIWNLKPGNGNSMYLKNSIAHKIYMADRQTEGGPVNNPSASSFQTIDEQPEPKTSADDSVSKRFEFMLGKKKSSNTTNKQTKKNSKKNTENDTQVKAKGSKKSRSKSNDFKKPMLSVNHDNNLMYESLLSDNTPQSDAFIDSRNDNDNKENIPPTNAISGDLDMINFEGINLKGDMNWLNSFNPFDYQNNSGNQQTNKGLNSTPQDINTCNTVTIENEDDEELQGQNEFNSNGLSHESSKTKLSTDGYVNTDIDKTSPIDNLSMPLLDILDDKTKSKTKNNSSVVLNIEVDDNDDEDEDNTNEDATSIVANNSTPMEQSTMSRIASMKKSISSIEEEDDDDEEQKRMTKKRRTIPSSPSMMFSYHDGSPNSEITNDLFTSFINNNDTSNNEENHDTPATICPSSDPAQKDTPF